MMGTGNLVPSLRSCTSVRISCEVDEGGRMKGQGQLAG